MIVPNKVDLIILKTYYIDKLMEINTSTK